MIGAQARTIDGRDRAAAPLRRPKPLGRAPVVSEPDPDIERMMRVRAGDTLAFRELVERWLRPLASFFHRLGADPSTAEDCSMEVFEKLHRTRTAYEARARFSTYLFAIARHHWIDLVRHRGILPPMISSDAADDGGGALGPGLVAPGGSPSSGAEEEEVLAALRRAVDALSPEHQEVFALAQAGLRYQDIASVLSIPVGTVKSRMHTAVAMLKDLLTRAGFEP